MQYAKKSRVHVYIIRRQHLRIQLQYPYSVSTQYLLCLPVFPFESLRDGTVVGINAVPLLRVFLQGWEERVIGTCMVLVNVTIHLPNPRHDLPNIKRSAPEACRAALRPTSE